MNSEQQIAELFRAHIPLTRAMGVVVQSYDGATLTITAPHEPNHNHLDTAFGGSLHALATLSAYGWLWLEMGVGKSSKPGAHVVVRESNMEYRKPVRGELRAVCRRPPAEALDRFWADFHARGKARIRLQATIEEAEQIAAVFSGEFVAVA